MRHILRSLVLTLVTAPLALGAGAQGFDDLDGSEGDSSGRARDLESQDVREIVRGFYAKSNIGGWMYVGSFRNYVSTGTSVALAVGQDFVDRPDSSMAWEISFFQGIHNGMHPSEQLADPAAPGLQGKLRTYSLTATLEWSTYLKRRFGLGLRGGGGIMFSPLLMTDEIWEQEYQKPGSPNYHAVPHPLVMVGPTFEYYTKMSHLSVGADVDAIYGIGLDLGISMTGYLKYTF